MMLYDSPEGWAEKLTTEGRATCTLTHSDDLLIVCTTLAEHAAKRGRRIRVFVTGPLHLTAVDRGPLDEKRRLVYESLDENEAIPAMQRAITVATDRSTVDASAIVETLNADGIVLCLERLA